jgi:hypothetical protein
MGNRVRFNVDIQHLQTWWSVYVVRKTRQTDALVSSSSNKGKLHISVILRGKH